MRRPHRTRLTSLWSERSRVGLGPPSILALSLLLSSACSGPTDTVDVPGKPGAVKTAAAERAERRAYDGAPPVIPHEDFGMTCTECHDLEGMAVEGVGFAPPSPHEWTLGMSAIVRCRQCHVFAESDAVFVANAFAGLRQDLRRGERFYDGAPPTRPHQAFMRENCVACHSGPAAREEIRTSHPERTRCAQCHVEVTTRAEFQRGEPS